MSDRLITLTVGTKEADEWFGTFQELSELAANLGVAHDYVDVSSTSFIDLSTGSFESDEFVVEREELHYDENTLMKVVAGINTAVPELTGEQVVDIVNAMQNEGILFRERA